MIWEVKEVSKDNLIDYSKIPMIIKVSSIYQLKKINKGLGGICLEEKKVKPYLKDLGENPLSWEKEFDVKNWAFFIVYDKEIPVGAATLAYNTKGVNMLKNRSDLCVLWDIRVHPDYKYQGIGKSLFKRCEEWAKSRNCSQLKIESQNNNPSACQFYVRNGCALGEINEYAYYGEYDDEVMLIWYKDLKIKE
ncbi:GNAT family N-acetyltransferase [Mycoplasmatota bacterium]|nr:GNAT family N-acetyltransferase [Mycoplasmatota bacterium]